MRNLTIVFLIIATAVVGWWLGAYFGNPFATLTANENQPSIARQTTLESKTPTTIRGQGKLVPARGLIHIFATPGDRVAELTEKQVGDQVSLDEILVSLSSRNLRQKDLELAKARRSDALAKADLEKRQLEYQLESSRLAVAEAYAQNQEIAKQAQSIELLKSQRKIAEKMLERLLNLQSNPASKSLVNQSDIDKQSLTVKQLQLQIEQAELEVKLATERAKRAQTMAENQRRTVEFSLANADQAIPFKSLNAAIDLAQQTTDQSQIRSPINGATIVEKLAQPGDSVTNQPIMVLGDLSQMNCEVEIIDSFLHLIDVAKHPNLRAKITVDAISKPLWGTVTAKGIMIGPISLKSPNPFAKVDQRTGTVTVKLDDSETAARYVNLQVDVEIEIEPGTFLSQD